MSMRNNMIFQFYYQTLVSQIKQVKQEANHTQLRVNACFYILFFLLWQAQLKAALLQCFKK